MRGFSFSQDSLNRNPAGILCLIVCPSTLALNPLALTSYCSLLGSVHCQWTVDFDEQCYGATFLPVFFFIDFRDNFVFYFYPFCSFVWLLNLIKSVELYYNNVFKEYLELPGDLQKKPDNWKNETTKLNDDEKLSRYFYNEFGVNR